MTNWSEVKAERFRVQPMCDKCGIRPAVEAHHVLVPDYKSYGSWPDVLVNCQPVCKACHTPGNYEGRLAWLQKQDADAVREWLSRAPGTAWTRVQEVERMLDNAMV